MISDRKVDLLIAFISGIAAKFDGGEFPRNATDQEATDWTLALLAGVKRRLEATAMPPATHCSNGHHVYATRDREGDWWAPSRCPVCNAPSQVPVVKPPGTAPDPNDNHTPPT